MNLVVDNISAGYGKTPVVSQINFSLGPGRICALMGRNGSGKTTLLRCINGILPLLAGKVSLMGKDINHLDRPQIAKRISVVPQVNFSPFSFSCTDMVMMAGAARIKAWSAPCESEKQKALTVMAETGIDHMAHRSFNSLSGGERQLVMLARGLFQDTPIMLLDEPNSHLDFANQHRIMALMQKLVKKRNISALITLHDPNLAHYYCDEVIMLKKGQVIAKGETQTTLTDEVLSRVLGDNIQCDITQKGFFVVTPKQINSTPKIKVTV